MAAVEFVLNEIRDQDPGLASRFEREISAAAEDIEPGERLECSIFLHPVAQGRENTLVRMRMGQEGWTREFPPVTLDTPPGSVAMAIGRLLRRHSRTELDG